MRKSLFLQACMLALSLSTVAPAAVLSFRDDTGDPSAGIIPAGGTASFTVALQSNDPYAGLSLYLADSSSGSSPRLTLTSRFKPSSNPFIAAITENPAPSGITSSPSIDLGYFAQSNVSNQNTLDLMTLTFTASPSLVAGTSIVLTTVSPTALSNASFSELPLNTASYTFTVVVPEPSGIAALVVGSAMLRRHRQTGR